MHELSIAQDVLQIIAQYVPSPDHGRVRSVRMRIGALAGVMTESLRFCFAVASEGTAADGAQLEIEAVPGRARCRACQDIFQPRDCILICPRCHGNCVDLVAGNELQVLELEVEECTAAISSGENAIPPGC